MYPDSGGILKQSHYTLVNFVRSAAFIGRFLAPPQCPDVGNLSTPATDSTSISPSHSGSSNQNAGGANTQTFANFIVVGPGDQRWAGGKTTPQFAQHCIRAGSLPSST